MRRLVLAMVVAAHAMMAQQQETLFPSPLPTPLPTPIPTALPSSRSSSSSPTQLPTPLPTPLSSNPTPLPTPSPSAPSMTWEYVYNEDELPNPRAEVRHENGFIEVEGEFYLIGGRGYKPTNVFGGDDWTKNGFTRNIHHFQAVAADGKIYIVCAFSEWWPEEIPLEHVLEYDIDRGKLVSGHVIPEARRRGAGGTVLYDDMIYVVGGITNGHVDGTVAWFDAYDRDNGDWVILDDAPHARDHVHVATIEDKLYVAGGRLSATDMANDEELVREVDVYDFFSRQWTVLNEPIPTPRAGAATVAWRRLLVVIGGESSGQQTAHDEVEYYDPAAEHWGTLPNLIRGRHGTSAFVYLDSIYVCAGSGNRGGGPELSSIEVFSG